VLIFIFPHLISNITNSLSGVGSGSKYPPIVNPSGDMKGKQGIGDIGAVQVS
jgi:hypothetical protein